MTPPSHHRPLSPTPVVIDDAVVERVVECEVKEEVVVECEVKEDAVVECEVKEDIVVESEVKEDAVVESIVEDAVVESEVKEQVVSDAPSPVHPRVTLVECWNAYTLQCLWKDSDINTETIDKGVRHTFTTPHSLTDWLEKPFLDDNDARWDCPLWQPIPHQIISVSIGSHSSSGNVLHQCTQPYTMRELVKSVVVQHIPAWVKTLQDSVFNEYDIVLLGDEPYECLYVHAVDVYPSHIVFVMGEL